MSKWSRHAQLSIVLFGEWTFALYQKLREYHREERLALMGSNYPYLLCLLL